MNLVSTYKIIINLKLVYLKLLYRKPWGDIRHFVAVILSRSFPLPHKHDPIPHKMHNPIAHTKIVRYRTEL